MRHDSPVENISGIDWNASDRMIRDVYRSSDAMLLRAAGRAVNALRSAVSRAMSDNGAGRVGTPANG